jgi:hypothetical protein
MSAVPAHCNVCIVMLQASTEATAATSVSRLTHEAIDERVSTADDRRVEATGALRAAIAPGVGASSRAHAEPGDGAAPVRGRGRAHRC